jgi:hypothetical protein
MKKRLSVIVSLVCTFLICALQSQMVLAATAGPSVARYLRPDGRIDLEAMRASGYQGPLDLKGFDVRVDRRSGQPVVRPSGASAVLENPDNQYWTEGFEIPGVDGGVSALTVYDNKLIAGGGFTAAGGVIANCVAAWDGSAWLPLGSGMSYGAYYGEICAMTVYDNKLIAGGVFTSAGGVEANSIAAWDGSAWSPLGSGMSYGAYCGEICAMTVYDNKLIAGGEFTSAGGVETNHIAAWDGSAWSPLGSGMSGSVNPLMWTTLVEALTVYDNKLIAGGTFTSAGGVGANCVAAWDGSAWSPMGSGMDDVVHALAVYDNKLIAGGEFFTASGAAAILIAAWNGSTWSALGSRIYGDGVYALTVYDNKLIAGGRVWRAGSYNVTGVAAWDGSTWSALGLGVSHFINVFVAYGTKLIAGGNFATAGGVPADNITSWDGLAWSALGSGTNASVYALTIYDDRLIAGGEFIMAGGVEAKHIAAWDGSIWSALGSGTNAAVFALTVYDNKLIAGGGFLTAGGVGAKGIAAWDGSTWSALASENIPAEALIVYDNKLIAGGYFTTAGGEANNIAAWDGSAWSALGSGMNDRVTALAVYDNKLIAGGNFTTAGSVEVNYIAAWDGSVWSPLGSGMSGNVEETFVKALTVYNDKLIAGGSFTSAGGVAANCVAAWGGSTWSALGSGMNDRVTALTVYDNKLIAGGWFGEAGGNAAFYVAAWEGSTWSPLGSGVGWYVNALTLYDNTLMVGGDFSIAGDKASGFLAQWTKHTSEATLLQDFAASYQGSSVEIKWQLSEPVSRESFVIERAERPGDFVELRGVEIMENGLSYSFSDAGVEPGMKCRYRVGLRGADGSREGLFETEEIAIPALATTLFQNYPNPFNPSTVINYYVPVECPVTLDIYDSSGKHVARLLDREKQSKGTHSVEWGGVDNQKQAVSSGVYFYRLTSGKKTLSRKMVLLK